MLSPSSVRLYIHFMTRGSLKTAVSVTSVHSVSRCLARTLIFPLHALAFRQWQVPLAFPRAWLSRRPRKDVETDQGSVHFFAFLPSPATPGRHCPLPVMHQVHRWVKLTEEKHKQSLIRSIWQWREEAAPQGVAAKTPAEGFPWLVESFCAFSCSIHVTASTRGCRLCPPGVQSQVTDCESKWLNKIT